MSLLVLANEYRQHVAKEPSNVIALTDRFNGQFLEGLIGAATMLRKTIDRGDNAGHYLMKHLASHDRVQKLDLYCQRLVTVLHWTLIAETFNARKGWDEGGAMETRAFKERIAPIMGILTGASIPFDDVESYHGWLNGFGDLDKQDRLVEFRRTWMVYRRIIATSPMEGEVGKTQTVAQSSLINSLIRYAPGEELEEFEEFLATEGDFGFHNAFQHDTIRNMVQWATKIDAVTFTSSIISFWMYKQKLVLPF